MKISSIQPIKLETMQSLEDKKTSAGFKDVLEQALAEVNNLQNSADSTAIAFASGHPNIDIHDVMIGMEKAQLALQLTIEVRNKLVEAYQEIMRMQL
ncbi:MAG: hypothetical protein VR72_01380 [Clostridiaceae bacterium BRH_c20a]|nr:MAG: hypothetical protein VR72_01380 [Clostridiaceae bacterium BRH_c20a]